MKLQSRYALSLVGLIGCGGAAVREPAAPQTVAARDPPAALDGRSFDVTLQIPEAPAQTDTLRFVGGKFESTACSALGFPEWSDYVSRADHDAIAFHVITKHPSGTTMDWNGSVKGDAVDGTANRTMNGKTDVLSFKGALRP